MEIPHGFHGFRAEWVGEGKELLYSVIGWHVTGKFLVNNYHQALRILQGEDALRASMAVHGFTGNDFNNWLKEERQYLENLKREPPEETLEMEYYTQLVKFYEYEYVPFHFSRIQAHVWKTATWRK